MKKKKKVVLVVDKDLQTSIILDIILDKSEFQVEECRTGKQAIQLSIALKPDIMLLCLSLPDMDSADIIQAIREWSQIPIIVISSRTAHEYAIKALEMGADDYVTKPFNADVLRARINAFLRKAAMFETELPELSNGPLRMDLMRHRVFLSDDLIALTPKEYKLLRLFISNRGRMLTHREILHEVWGPAHSDDTQYLRVFVGQLRKKIEKNPYMPAIIRTEPGIGYMMAVLPDLSRNRQGELEI